MLIVSREKYKKVYFFFDCDENGFILFSIQDVSKMFGHT
jgi:hypothetical protein